MVVKSDRLGAGGASVSHHPPTLQTGGKHVVRLGSPPPELGGGQQRRTNTNEIPKTKLSERISFLTPQLKQLLVDADLFLREMPPLRAKARECLEEVLAHYDNCTRSPSKEDSILYSRAYYELSRLLSQEENPDLGKIIQLFETSSQIEDVDGQSSYMLAKIYLNLSERALGEDKKALALKRGKGCLVRSLRANSRHAGSLILRKYVGLIEEDDEVAGEHILAYIRGMTVPSKAELMYYYAKLAKGGFFGKTHRQNAEQVFEEVAKKLPNEDYRKKKARMYVGLLSFDRGDLAKAAGWLLESVKNVSARTKEVFTVLFRIHLRFSQGSEEAAVNVLDSLGVPAAMGAEDCFKACGANIKYAKTAEVIYPPPLEGMDDLDTGQFPDDKALADYLKKMFIEDNFFGQKTDALCDAFLENLPEDLSCVGKSMQKTPQLWKVMSICNQREGSPDLYRDDFIQAKNIFIDGYVRDRCRKDFRMREFAEAFQNEFSCSYSLDGFNQSLLAGTLEVAADPYAEENLAILRAVYPDLYDSFRKLVVCALISYATSKSRTLAVTESRYLLEEYARPSCEVSSPWSARAKWYCRNVLDDPRLEEGKGGGALLLLEGVFGKKGYEICTETMRGIVNPKACLAMSLLYSLLSFSKLLAKIDAPARCF